LILSLAALTSACGVGGHDQIAEASEQVVTVALAGTVTGTPGALTFNRLPLHTGSALVTAQGRPASSAKIRPGSVIRGTANKTALGYDLQSADVHHEVEGIIERVDPAASRLKVMGQLVRVEAFTDIGEEGPDEASSCLQLTDLKAGDRIEVDGFEAADGSVLATRIEQVPSTPSLEGSFHAVLDDLNAAAKTALARGCLVSFGEALISGALANGRRVEIHGSPAGKILHATWVKVETGLEDLEGAILEVCGPISAFDPVGKTFMVMTYKVDYSRAKVEGTLANGASVMAEARLSVGGGGATASYSRVKAGPGISLRALSARAESSDGAGSYRHVAPWRVTSIG
jgi:hypothetical protein